MADSTKEDGLQHVLKVLDQELRQDQVEAVEDAVKM